MKTVKISKQSVKAANRILVERSKNPHTPVRSGGIRLSANEINSAYKRVLSDGKKV